jgi:hypothetical protein
MVELSFWVFANLKDHRIQTITYPANHAMLSGKIGTLVGIVGMEENLLCLLEADSAPRIFPKALALPRIEVESHEGITVIPYLSRMFGRNLGENTHARPPMLQHAPCGPGKAATSSRRKLYTRCASCYCFFPYRHPCARRLGL